MKGQAKLEYLRAWRRANAEKTKAYDARPDRRAYKAKMERTERTKAVRRAWKEKNLDRHKLYHQKYETVYRQRRKELHDRKQVSDPQYRLRRTLRANLKNALNKNHKSGSAVRMLGCSTAELKVHLENQFLPGMSWQKFGRLAGEGTTWQIDHIIPLSAFDLTDQSQLRKACHYTNLRPLWALENRRKANKILSRQEVSYAQ